MKNESKGVDRRIAPGLDLRLGGAWSGLGLGWSDTLVAQPDSIHDTEPSARAWGYVPPAGLGRRATDGTEWRLGWVLAPHRESDGRVTFVRSTQLGAQLRWGDWARGVGLGWSRETALRADPEVDGVYLATCGDGPISCELRQIRVEEE